MTGMEVLEWTAAQTRQGKGQNEDNLSDKMNSKSPFWWSSRPVDCAALTKDGQGPWERAVGYVETDPFLVIPRETKG
jgi:hypothetical protein